MAKDSSTDTPTATKSESGLRPSDEAIKRFNQSLKRTVEDKRKLGLAVSGGPDSIALLLLAAAARPGQVEAATVDHALRDDSRKEAEMVAALCEKLGIPHEILTVEWKKKPETAIQERARNRRYALLGAWAKKQGIDVLATAHHADDQAETLMMRLARGAGVHGLAGMRAFRKSPGSETAVARPLLNWTRQELADICKKAGVDTVADPSNVDPKFERTRVREFLAGADWLDPVGLGKSASYLNQADAALTWASRQEWQKRVTESDAAIVFEPDGLPEEITRRIVRSILEKMKSEGRKVDLRGSEIDQLLRVLVRGRRATLRGVLASGGPVWRFEKAPERKKANAPAA